MRHVLCSVLELETGANAVTELHRGPLEECERIAGIIRRVTDSTGRQAVRALLCTPTEDEFDAVRALAAGADRREA